MVYLTIVTAAKNVSVMSDLYPRMISSSISASPYSLKFHVRENTFLITGSPKISIKGAAIAIIAGVIGSPFNSSSSLNSSPGAYISG
jgi:hypothetical protein